ncbi:MAG: ATP-binding protein [Xanthomonadales bacterium]|nr:ATP-binding protein [Xanthomonadales bacterium]MBK7146290.1 ATP-binding protein [Xanthomonadales bacterium]MCC6562265.1 ATP-binding protein [Xanthomonadales bacterium]
MAVCMARWWAPSVEHAHHSPGRGLDKRLIATLSGGDWIRQKQSLLITGPTGVGKTWLACALAQHACRQGFPALYQRVPRLTEALRIAHADGSFGKLLAQLARIDVLILDDWGMTPLDQAARHDLLEVIDEQIPYVFAHIRFDAKLNRNVPIYDEPGRWRRFQPGG